MAGGEIDKNALIESFARIKEDIILLKQEVQSLKKENYDLKTKLSDYENNFSNSKKDSQIVKSYDKNTSDSGNNLNRDTNLNIDKLGDNLNNRNNIDLIKNLVLESIEIALKKQKRPTFIDRINKKRKNIIINRILSLSEKKNYSTSDLKEIIVDQENLCSKATYYRYIEKLRKKQLIDIIKIEENEIVARI